MLDSNTAYMKDPNNPNNYLVMMDIPYKSLYPHSLDIINHSIETKTVSKYLGNSYVDENMHYYEGKDSGVLVLENISIDQLQNIRQSTLQSKKVLEYIEKQYSYSISNLFDSRITDLNRLEGPISTDDVFEIFEGRNIQTHDRDQFLVSAQFGDKKFLGYIVLNASLNPKFDVLNKFQEYEMIIDSKDNIKETGDYILEMRKLAYNKSAKSYIYSLRRDAKKKKNKAKELLALNPDTIFTLEDSYMVGNCKVGTKSFVERFKLDNEMSAQAILNHHQFDEIINNKYFQFVVINKHLEEEI